ncbi:Uncharacterised protein [Hungatella hathewayi]|nr:Uncharacterised protein [Hungatella hathewayi]
MLLIGTQRQTNYLIDFQEGLCIILQFVKMKKNA